MRSFLDFVLPWRRGGIRPHDAVHALITLALAVALIAVGFGAGYHTAQSRYTAAYWQAHYANLGLAQPASLRVGAAPLPHLRTDQAAGISPSVYPQPLDQGAEGSCAAVSSSQVASLDIRQLPVHHPHINLSGQWEYDAYADTYSNGQDVGSWFDQDLAPIETLGIPQLRKYPLAGHITDPFPTQSQASAAYANAAKLRFRLQMGDLYNGTPSDTVPQEILAALQSGKPALIAIQVTPSYDAATQNGGNVSYSGPESNRGAHGISVFRYDPTHIMADGSPGFLSNGSWGPYFGLHGRVWLSWNWLAAFAYAVETATLSVS